MAKSPKTIVDRELIHELTKLLDETGLTEIEIEQEGKRVRVARSASVSAAPAALRVEVAPGRGDIANGRYCLCCGRARRQAFHRYR